MNPTAVNRTSIGARRDVIKNQFIGACLAVAGREFKDIADTLMITKTHALDDDAIAYIETRNYATGKNGANSVAVNRFSMSARPLMAALTPVPANAARSRPSRMPPEACQAMCGKR